MAIQFTGLASGLDTQSIISDLMKIERMRVENVEKDKVLAEWRKEEWQEMNSNLYSFYKDEMFKFKSQGTYNQKSLKNSNDDLISLNTSTGAIRGSHSIEVVKMAKGSHLTGSELVGITSATTAADLSTFADPANDVKKLTINVDGTDHDISVVATDNIENIITKIEELDLDLNVSYDSNFGRMFFSSTETGQSIRLELSSSDGTGDDLLTGLGFDVSDPANLIGTQGERAEFKYNGTTLYSESNEVSVNGLSFNILAEGGSSTVSVTQDTEAVYESVKAFILKYNEVMLDIDEKISADSAREYEPLTDEEKDVMSEDDIELWESKIKASLLRRDETLSAISDEMRSTLTLSYGVDVSGFEYKSLSELGISTGGYEENGILHIEGDEDDPLYSVKDNKLREAIDDNPDGVMELLSALGDELYSKFAERMKSSTLSSALTFYNDKAIDKQINDYEDDILDLEDRLAMVEDRYYKQFTAMEQAIQRSNSTGEWLAQQLGGMM